jgi:hypothetical protein
MEQNQVQINKTLIKQYSRFAYLKPDQLTEIIQQIEWWNKEQTNLKIQQKVSLVCITIGIISFLLIVLFSFSRGVVPMQSFIGCTLSFFVLQRIYFRVEERIRIYKLLSLTFNSGLVATEL